MRAGAYVPSLLASPGVSSALRALEAGPMPLAELRRAVGFPPQTTMRVQLRELTALGALARGREGDFPRSVNYELTESGRNLLAVADILERWLGRAASDVGRLGDASAKRAVKALTEGWEAGIVGILAAEPRSLTQISQEISMLSYPSIERRLTAMRAVGLVEVVEADGPGVLCQPTAWLRHAAAPLAAASGLERSGAVGQHPKVDIQALLLLAMPIVRLPEGSNGAATLATRQPPPQGGGDRPAPEAVTVEIMHGLPRSCAATLDERAESWVLGVPQGWLNAVVFGVLDGLRFGGPKPELAERVVSTLHTALRGRSAGSTERQAADATR